MKTRAPMNDPFTYGDDDEEDRFFGDGVPNYLNINLGVTNVESIRKDGDQQKLCLTCQGIHQGEVVGFDLVIKRFMPWGQRHTGNYPKEFFADTGRVLVFNPEGWVEKGVQIVSRGQETERILQFMSDHYSVQPRDIIGCGKQENIGLTAKAFSPEEHDVLEQFSEIKLVYENYNDDDNIDDVFWQAFLRIDPSIGAIRLEEKDVDYRQAQINVMYDSFFLSESS